MCKTFFSNKIIIITIISYIIIKIAYCDDCLTNSYQDLTFAKAKTLSNGYHLLISAEGIYSFKPHLSKIVFSYNFTESQKFSTEIHSFENTINQVEISQFPNDEGGENYTLCLVNNSIYFLTQFGKVIFYQELTYKIEVESPINLIPFKYSDNSYYFVIAHNYGNQDSTIKKIYFYYYKITQEQKLEFVTKNEYSFSDGDDLNIYTLSCQKIYSPLKGKVILCFINVNQNPGQIYGISFNPDNNFGFSSMSPTIFENDSDRINVIKSCINEEENIIFVCYITESPNKSKCFYYNILVNMNSEIIYEDINCNTKYFSLNLNHYDKSNNYIFSCVDNNKQNIYIRKFDNEFNTINDTSFYGKSFDNCYSYNYLSIIYISDYDKLTGIVQSNCNSGNFIRFFLLSNDCIMPNEEEDDILFPDTTNIKITITNPLIETTISKIITTIPIIETTIPKIITTIPIIETTILRIITTIPIIETTIPKIITNIYESENLEKTEFSTQLICKDKNKIYYKGECICDIYNEYYSIKSSSKCYKKDDLPKNVYFNYISQSYELCYKTCETCIKGGNYSVHNCINCASNFIHEPKINSTNCVNNCKYFYYYNSYNQFSCTVDEQCPKEASLIIRNKSKCINKCSNDDTNIYQYNGECLSSCPNNTEVNKYNICKIIDSKMCSTNDYLLNLDQTINQDNVILAAQNYAKEFYYTINHISRFLSNNFTMVFYKNSSCIEQLNLNSTKIEYDSCIKQIKKDNNINENDDIIIAVIDIFTGNNPITSFGFFNSKNGEKLDGTKSCSDKNVIMYEDIINVLNDPLALKLLKEQKINIFDLENEFYNDICFHFDSPNGKDATLQDRIRTFYPNITLCDQGCKNRGVNITSMKAECECKFQDLLSNDLFHNDIIGDNVIIKETINNIIEMISNLNLEVLSCYKDVFNYQYFKKNIGGFIIIALIIIQIICYIYYYLISNKYLVKYICILTDLYKNFKRNNNCSLITVNNPPKNEGRKVKLKENKTIVIHRNKTINMNKNGKENSKVKNINPNCDKENNKKYNIKKKGNKSSKSVSIFKKKKDKAKKININIKIQN